MSYIFSLPLFILFPFPSLTKPDSHMKIWSQYARKTFRFRVLYTERKPKNKKQGRSGNEAIISVLVLIKNTEVQVYNVDDTAFRDIQNLYFVVYIYTPNSSLVPRPSLFCSLVCVPYNNTQKKKSGFSTSMYYTERKPKTKNGGGLEIHHSGVHADTAINITYAVNCIVVPTHSNFCGHSKVTINIH